jgi:hypothetical protein
MRSAFAKLTITRLRYPVTTDRGVQVTDWTATPEESEIARCWYEPAVSQTNEGSRFAVSSGYTVDAPKGTVLSARTDHVRIAGEEFALSGDPQVVPSPTGTLDSVKFSCERWDG